MMCTSTPRQAGRSANTLRSVLLIELQANAQTELDEGDREGKFAGATVHVRLLPNVGRESHTFLPRRARV